MLMDHLGQRTDADRVRSALAQVIQEGKNVTYDLKPRRGDPTAVGTTEMTEAIISKMTTK
jgi:isocitrate dehydrogenase (NAD+)